MMFLIKIERNDVKTGLVVFTYKSDNRIFFKRNDSFFVLKNDRLKKRFTE